MNHPSPLAWRVFTRSAEIINIVGVLYPVQDMTLNAPSLGSVGQPNRTRSTPPGSACGLSLEERARQAGKIRPYLRSAKAESRIK
jgi:hypothetical protein